MLPSQFPVRFHVNDPRTTVLHRNACGRFQTSGEVLQGSMQGIVPTFESYRIPTTNLEVILVLQAREKQGVGSRWRVIGSGIWHRMGYADGKLKLAAPVS